MAKGIYREPITLSGSAGRTACVYFVSYVHPDISGEFYRKMLEYSMELETILMVEYGL